MGDAKVMLTNCTLLTGCRQFRRKTETRAMIKQCGQMLTSPTVRNKSGLSSVTILFVRPP